MQPGVRLISQKICKPLGLIGHGSRKTIHFVLQIVTRIQIALVNQSQSHINGEELEQENKKGRILLDGVHYFFNKFMQFLLCR